MARVKWCRKVTGLSKPTAAPISSIDIALSSSGGRLAMIRWEMTQRSGCRGRLRQRHSAARPG